MEAKAPGHRVTVVKQSYTLGGWIRSSMEKPHADHYLVTDF